MQTIYKYPLRVTDLQTVSMPRGAEVLTTQLQRDEICLWAIVNSEQSIEERVFEIIGTGHSHAVGGDVKRRYVATVQQGPLVWHVFERL